MNNVRIKFLTLCRVAQFHNLKIVQNLLEFSKRKSKKMEIKLPLHNEIGVYYRGAKQNIRLNDVLHLLYNSKANRKKNTELSTNFIKN